MPSLEKCKKHGKTVGVKTRRCRKKCAPPKYRKGHTLKCILACKKGQERGTKNNHCRRKCKARGTCRR